MKLWVLRNRDTGKYFHFRGYGNDTQLIQDAFITENGCHAGTYISVPVEVTIQLIEEEKENESRTDIEN